MSLNHHTSKHSYQSWVFKNKEIFYAYIRIGGVFCRVAGQLNLNLTGPLLRGKKNKKTCTNTALPTAFQQKLPSTKFSSNKI